ncbi:pentatricopeptide repeat-containing protein At5g39710 [Mangifera indica]|uniref:pentatricopeptide repeat-containing protein At5g39710 n=1 Tax=Mangifera indica TaxID=29780 RepID=UPI001CFA9597|nr:pentatricopeptide repeat-containing protein At5g39710 [Mangifera indica]XP_044487918.1 pentatricopeptide repeat-containing protein At5g39710 [Mangifera indica]
MPFPNLQIYRSFSRLSSPNDALLADKALTFLRRHPYQLNSLSSDFTSEAALNLLLRIQSDQTLTLKFLKWAQPHPFFTPKLKCLTLHILTKFKLYNSAKTLAQSLAVSLTNDEGSIVFSCLKDTYHLCDSSSSSAVFDLVVKSYSSLNMIDKALNVVNLAKLNGFMPGVLSYNAILDSIIRTRGNNWVKFAEKVYDEMIRSKISPNVFTYNILIRGFCVEGNLDMGLRFFSQMEKNGCLPNVVTYNTLIDGYCKSRRIDDAYKLLRTLSLKGIEPNLISYNVIINGLCKGGRLKETSEVLKEISRKGFVPDEVTYNTLVDGYCKEGDFHQALVLHAEMVGNGLRPNVVTYTALIDSMCKAGNLNRAMEFFDQMRVRGLHPNERTYTTLINGFSQQGFLNEAHRLLIEMTENGFVPSIVTYNALINGHCIVGRIEEALGVIQVMVEKGLTPDVVSYCTIISGFCRNQELDKAFEMKQWMVEKGVPLDAVTYSTLIRGLCDKGRLIEACDLFQEMLNSGLSPDEITYTTLINAYCTEGDISMAFHLHDEMIQKGFLPDVVTYSVLINGLNKRTRTKEAKKLLLKSFYDESVPTDVTYNTLIENCSNIGFKSVMALLKGFCMKGLMNEADQVFESMIQRNHKPNEAVYNIIIHGHSGSGNVQKGYELYKEMVQYGFVAHTVTIIALAKALFMAGMNEELSLVVGHTLRSCRLTDAELAKALVEINHKEGNMDAVLNVLTEMAKDGLLPNSGRSTNHGI